MIGGNKDAPFKILIKEISDLQKTDSGWLCKVDENYPFINFNKVHIQGEICKTSGFSGEILIIDDGTGKARVTRGPQVPGDLSWINTGVPCSVVGTLMDNGKLPHIVANKIAKISNKILLEMWPWEVKELKNVLINKISPRLDEG